MRAERGCRACGTPLRRCERAHIIGRARDNRNGVVDPDDIVPLCRACHSAYDSHRLDLAPYLTRAELERAIRIEGHHRAARRIRSSRTPRPLLAEVPWNPLV